MAEIQVVDVLFPGERQRSQRFRRSLSRLESVVNLAGTSLKAVIQFDAVITRGHKMSSTVTSDPVEDGSEASDHVILAPRELTLAAMVSDHPIDPEVLARNPLVLDADGFPVEAQPTRSQVAATLLEALWRDKVRLKIVTKFKTYENMLIQDMSWDESSDVGEALAATIVLRELRTAALVLVPTERLAPSSSDLASRKVERGRRSTTVLGQINDAKSRAGAAVKNVLTGNF